MERPRSGELAREQRDLRGFGQCEVIGLDAGARQQVGDDDLVHVGVLAHVERREMEAEGAHGLHERREPSCREDRRAVRRERCADHLEVRQQFADRAVRRECRMRRARGNARRERRRRRRETRVDAGQCLPVGLVLPMRIGVAGRGRQCQQVRGRLHEALRQRQLGAQAVDRVEVVIERHGGLRPDRVFERARHDERVAVAVAADPRSHPQERRHADARAEPPLERDGQTLVDPRHLREERVAVVREAVVDLVGDLQLGQPQHRRLPQRQHLPVEARFPLGDFVGRQQRAIAPHQQARDLALAIEDALALDFGRVRRQHRRHQRLGEPVGERGGPDAGLREMRERRVDAAPLRWRAGQRVDAAAPVLVHVFREVREVRKIGKRAHDVERVGDRQVIEQRRQFGAHVARIGRFGAAKADRGLADRLDARIGILAGVAAQHVAQQPAEQAGVFLERLVAVERIVEHRGQV